MNQRFRLASTSAAALLLTLGACGESSDDPTATPDACAEALAATDLPAAYAIASSVFGDAGNFTYVSVLDSLGAQTIDQNKAAEHAGFATIAASNGALFVGDGEAPVIGRYAVGAGGESLACGEVGFDFYGLQTAPMYLNGFVDADTAYMVREETRRVVWNPSTMEITGTADAPGLEKARGDLQVRAGYDRAIVARDGYVFHAFYWTDANYYRFDAGSQIAVYDAATGDLVDLLDAPCPGLDVATVDESGNIYFSNWVFSAAAPVLDESAPATCAVRIPAGELAIDDTWTRSLNDLVEGRQTAAFRYLGDGLGLVAALDADRITITEETLPGEITGGSNWRLWLVNLETGTGTPVDGLGHMAGGYYSFTIDGRTLLLLPAADYSRTTVYELTADGKAAALFETAGWAYQMTKIR